MSGPNCTCGCCSGFALATPMPIENRPGLSAVAYRIGVHSHFKASLLARLAHSTHPALQRLTTRRDDDFAIALCDGWATVADVLTFYQERIANESWLRTATERRSVGELARLIDYALRPGVAASTTLAFTIETGTGAPAETLIPVGTKVMSVPGPGEKPQTFETTAELKARGAWNELHAKQRKPGSIATGDTALAIDGVNSLLEVGDRLLFVGAARQTSATSADWQVRTLDYVVIDRENASTIVSWTGALPALGAPVKVYALRQRAALFGNNAPDPKQLAADTRTAYSGNFLLTPAGAIIDWNFQADGAQIYLDGVFSSAQPGQHVLMENEVGTTRLYDINAVRTVSRNGYTLSLRTTRLTLLPTTDISSFHSIHLRGSSALLHGSALTLADVPISDPVELATIVLDSTVTLPAGRLLLVQGTDADSGEAVGETATVQSAEPYQGSTRIILKSNLAHRYVPASLKIFANMAPATHGETVREVLGSGDGSRALARLKLKQAPLTYVPARTATGAASTLELRVNGLLWKEVRTLLDADPHERVYTARQEDDGATVVQFGDGVNGARVPTGVENLTSVYRKGIGLAGLLASEQLSMLITRPLGARAVSNPLPTEGAEAPESVDAARRNCTLTIHTLDRVVSLFDYEDFARAFGGVAKAQATWFWNGQRRGVFLTVAGAGGQTIDPGSELRANLIAELRKAGDITVPIDVRPHVERQFGALVALAVAADEVRETVHARVRAALLEHFSFAARDLMQSVTIDELLAVVQVVQGVVAANVTRLNFDDDAGVETRLAASGPQVTTATPLGAELLIIEPAYLELTDLA